MAESGSLTVVGIGPGSLARAHAGGCVMARVGRLVGALLVQTVENAAPAWFLVGDTKVPCDWAVAGFRKPAERDAASVRWVRLEVTGDPVLATPVLTSPNEGEAAAALLADRLLVARNGSVGERLLRLIVGEDDVLGGGAQDARWLAELPPRVWDVVRDAVLKCT